MAEYTDGILKTIRAGEVHGGEVALYVGHGPGLLMLSDLMPLNKKELVGIVDVTGSADGAGSIVKMRWNYLSGAKYETCRVIETPDSLRTVFKQAGIPFPKVEKSLGRIGRDVVAALSHKPV